MKKYVRSSKYTLYGVGNDIIAEGNNKAELIKKADRMNTPATLEDNYGIIYENLAQQKINNRGSLDEPRMSSDFYDYYGIDNPHSAEPDDYL